MIIRKKVKSDNSSKSQTNQKSSSNTRGNVIKKEDIILDVNKAKNTNKYNEIEPSVSLNDKIGDNDEFEKIDISSIEFKERVERRRGDRRRGYRRIDERSLVSRAQQEAHTIKELAAREGYQNGLKKAEDEIDYIKNSLNEFLNMRDEMYEEFYPHLMELALSAAKKVIKKEVELDNGILKEIIYSTLDEFNSDVQKIELKVNPQDVEFASVSVPDIIESRGGGIKLTVLQDETVEKGSCVVIANNGVIDANFKTQLAVLQNAFGIYKGGL